MCASPSDHDDQQLLYKTPTSAVTPADDGDDDCRHHHTEDPCSPTSVTRFGGKSSPLKQQQRAVTPPIISDSDSDGDGCLRVSFTENQVFMVRTALMCLENLDERRDLWYNREDIQGFRRDAQIISKKIRDNNARHSHMSGDDEDSDSDYDDHDDHDDDEQDQAEPVCTRGLELRVSPQRQDRKQRVVQSVLKAQRLRHTGAKQMARIARENAVFSSQIAQKQAHEDYYAVYHPHLLSTTTPTLASCLVPNLIEPRATIGAVNNAPTGQKRSLLSSQPPLMGRRVRCRMY